MSGHDEQAVKTYRDCLTHKMVNSVYVRTSYYTAYSSHLFVSVWSRGRLTIPTPGMLAGIDTNLP